MKNLNLEHNQYGNGQRLLLQEKVLSGGLKIPKAVEYDDIDNAMIEFFDAAIDLNDDNGQKVPIFKLLSNQRFSEYSQMWERTDKDGNPFLNFKTITRETNPKWGTIHASMANIPGDNRFTIQMKEILDKNGIECYEITSMSQPLSVDLIYTIGFISTKMQKINEFNMQVLNLFKSKQCYVFPNNHPMPMVLEQINDESNYEIDGRKFYSQTVSIKLMAYIIPEGDIKIEVKPKRTIVKTNETVTKQKNNISIEQINDTKFFNLTITLNPHVTIISFHMDKSCQIKIINKHNVHQITIKINRDKYSTDDVLTITPNDEISIKITKPLPKEQSTITFRGLFI